MKQLFLLLLLITACTSVDEKIFVANEESGTISVIDASTLAVIDTVTLTLEHDGGRLGYAPHNVQSVRDLILVTANAEGYAHEHTELLPAVEAHGDEDATPEHPDQLVVIDARTDKIVQRYDLDIGAHLAHVVSDGRVAYVTGTNTDTLYSVDLSSGAKRMIELPQGAHPHGLRLSTDNTTAYIASMNNSLLVLDLASKQIKTAALPGMAVQTAVTPEYAFVSVYSPAQIGRYDIATGNMTLVSLPNSDGPIQLYPTPDFKYVYIADQGMLMGKKPGSSLYKIDVETLAVTSIHAGNAPHGVVVSPDGRVFVTNVLGGDVSVFANDKSLSEIPVGAAPNGITYWSHNI